MTSTPLAVPETERIAALLSELMGRIAPPPPPPPKPTPPPSSTKTNDCNPPFFFDGNKKVFKPNCI